MPYLVRLARFAARATSLGGVAGRGRAAIRLAVSILVATALVPAPMASARKKPAPVAGWAQVDLKVRGFRTSEELLSWIAAYRHAPEPARLPEAVQTMISGGLLKDFDQAGMYVGFAAGVLGANPNLARDLVERMFPLPPEHQVVVVKAIAFSGLADWKDILRGVAERMPARAVLIDKYLYRDAPTLDTLSLETGGAFAIDANWGYFFATGSPTPVERIVKALAWTSEDKKTQERLTLGLMAKWTIANNAQRNEDLLRILKASLSHQPKEIATPLADALDAAESYELGRLRTAATKAVDELKAKGPAGTGWRWWGEAGTTVLALGCVAASALGQVEVGIPCVIGGAAATAGTKFFLPQ